MTKLTGAFRNFVNAPKNVIQSGRKLRRESWKGRRVLVDD